MTSCIMGGWQPCLYLLGSKEMDTGAMQAVKQVLYIYIINFHGIFICVKGFFAHLLAFILWVSAGSQGFLRKKE